MKESWEIVFFISLHMINGFKKYVPIYFLYNTVKCNLKLSLKLSRNKFKKNRLKYLTKLGEDLAVSLYHFGLINSIFKIIPFLILMNNV